MKRTIAASVLTMSLLIAGPSRAVLAGPETGMHPQRPAVNSQTAHVLESAAKVNVVPEKKPAVSVLPKQGTKRIQTKKSTESNGTSSAQSTGKKKKSSRKRKTKEVVSRGETGTFNADKVVRLAVSLRGASYKWSGQTPDGFDCSGFTKYVYKAGAGIDLPRTSSGQASFGEAVSKGDLEPADLVYFNTSGSGVSHVGIYIGGGNFVSATSSDGVKVSSLDESYWADCYLGGRRVR